MTTKAAGSCLVCSGTFLEALISVPGVPALTNRVCASEREAAEAARGDISLAYCPACGHVVNAAFDQVLVNYDGRFENTLSFSPHYRRYAETTAARIIDRFGLRGSRIVEIGCGAGDFLRLLCNGGNHGIGYDPTQTTSRSAAGRGSIEIIGRNFEVEDARDADLVCCRHVLEHLPEPMELLRGLYQKIAIGRDAVVFFEVPNAIFTLDRLGIWDIIHEHVSYFTPSSLARAFHDAGFTVCGWDSAFDAQYLWLEARVKGGSFPASDMPIRPPDTLYSSFGTRFADKISQWRRRISDLRSDGRRVVIWGAGAKGVMFLNLLQITAGAGIDWVVDINPRKQGHFVPIMGQRIVGPKCLLQAPPDLVIVMNPEYECEVRTMIDEIGIRCEVVSA